jgi:hypothetical protein
MIDFFSNIFDSMKRIIEPAIIQECAGQVLNLLNGGELGVLLSKEDPNSAEILQKYETDCDYHSLILICFY